MHRNKTINYTHCCNDESNEETLRHKAKVLTKEEVEANRSSAYNYLEL
jgi:hypothetical protein